MKLVLISDTHQQHKRIRMPRGDVLVHAGDFCSRGTAEEVKAFGAWLRGLDYRHIVFISGNHDRLFERNRRKALGHIPRKTDSGGKIHYLQDSFIRIENVKFYGSPWQPKFYNWAFNLPRDGTQLKSKWDKIPEDTNVLITHCPPHGILDMPWLRSERIGCKLLFQRVLDIKPKLHVFGHCHEGYGMVHHLLDGTVFVNASIVNDYHYAEHRPVEFEEDFDGLWKDEPRTKKDTGSAGGSGQEGDGFIGEGI